MTYIRSAFNRFGEFYNLIFYDWLHIHFIIRTAILLVVLWMIVYICAQVFRYLIAPAALCVHHTVVNTAKRGRRARYYAYEGYVDMVRRSGKPAFRLMLICGIALTLPVLAFGLHREYATPAAAMPVDAHIAEGGLPTYTPTPRENDTYAPHQYSGWPKSAAWPPDMEIILYLNELGRQGTRLRSGPGIAEYTVIEILWDNDLLVYLYSSHRDAYAEGLYWLRVLSPTGTEGYVSSELVGIVGG